MTIRELTFDEVDLVSGGEDEPVDEIVVVGTRRSEGVRMLFFASGHTYSIDISNWEEVYSGPVGEPDQARRRSSSGSVIVEATPRFTKGGALVWDRVYSNVHEV